MSGEIENLSGRNLSSSDDLDILFNVKDGILSEVSFHNADETMIFDKELAPGTDDLFSNLLNEDFDLTSISQTTYDYPVASPENSDSGISDGINSPQYQSDSQSSGSPQRIDELEEVIMESADMSSYLIGSDTMLSELPTVDGTAFESGGFEWDLQLTKGDSKNSTLPLTVQDVKMMSAMTATRTISTTDSSYPELRLTDEEKRLLSDMNVNLPADMPLTKEEERALKTVRRKIRNKISAMDSRKRKKVYVDGLEHRVHLCTKQNHEMQKKMAKLENENQSLMVQLKKLQSLVSKTTTKAAHASTCVMVLLLSFALLIAPSFNPFTQSQDSQMPAGYQPSGVVSRTLKHTDMPTEEPYSMTTEPSPLDDALEDDEQPIAMRRFAKPTYHKPADIPATNQKTESDAEADSGAKHEAVSANEVNSPEDTIEAVSPEVKSSSVNQSSTDTGQKTQQQQVKRVSVHGDEI